MPGRHPFTTDQPYQPEHSSKSTTKQCIVKLHLQPCRPPAVLLAPYPASPLPCIVLARHSICRVRIPPQYPKGKRKPFDVCCCSQQMQHAHKASLALRMTEAALPSWMWLGASFCSRGLEKCLGFRKRSFRSSPTMPRGSLRKRRRLSPSRCRLCSNGRPLKHRRDALRS